MIFLWIKKSDIEILKFQNRNNSSFCHIFSFEWDIQKKEKIALIKLKNWAYQKSWIKIKEINPNKI